MPRYSTIRTKNLYLRNHKVLVDSDEINALAGVNTNITVQTQLNNILNNTDPATIDSFTEAVADYTSAVALKANVNNPTFTGVVSLPNNTIDNTTNNRVKINAQVFELGNGNNETILESKGNQNIILKSGSAPSGTIEIIKGADTDIHIYPNGTGIVKMSSDLNLASGKKFKINGTPIQISDLGDGANIQSDIIKLNNTPVIIYVDSNRNDSYTEDGSKMNPYKTLNSALVSKLTNSETTTYLFKLSAGNYDGVVNIDQDTQNQSFSIVGEGKDITFIRGSASFDNTVSNVLYFRDFNEITVKNLTIQNGAYGFYPRTCKKIILENIKFLNNGSAGTVSRHDFTGTQSEQATYWSSSNTSDGGACRIRSCEEVIIENCNVEYCARGLRIQDCGMTGKNSIISGCKIYRTLEAGIYLAAGSYDGTDGCENFTVIGNTIDESFNNSILVIGGYNNIIKNNVCMNGSNAGIQSWSSLNNIIDGNSIFNCNRNIYNGIGNLGDAYGNLVVDGNINIRSGGTYISMLSNNSILKCNQGRAGSIIGINLHPTIVSGSYPSESNKVITSLNVSDATTRVNNPQPLTRTLNTNEIYEEISARTIMDVDLQGQINTKQATLNATQLITVNKTIAPVASGDNTNIATCDVIKTYVDSQAGGFSEMFIDDGVSGDDGNPIDVPADCHSLLWTRNGGSAGGSSRAFNLPEFGSQSNDGHTIHIHAFGNTIYSSGTVFNTGSIDLIITESNCEFRYSIYDNVDFQNIAGGIDSTQMRINKPLRKTYIAIYEYYSNGSRYWYVKQVSSNFGYTKEQQLISNTVAINKQLFSKMFLKTDETYKIYNNEDYGGSETNSNDFGVWFQLPSGYNQYRVIYGDGTDYKDGINDSSISAQIKLPKDPVNGCCVEIFTSLRSSATSKDQMICIGWDDKVTLDDGTASTIPSGRTISWHHTGGDSGTNVVANDGTDPLVLIRSRPSGILAKRIYAYFCDEGDGYWVIGHDSN